MGADLLVAEQEAYALMGLNEAEYRQICQVLGREPTRTELGMYAVMWSEHCGYKYSRPVLRRFRNYREAADAGTMENAGGVPIGSGLSVVFKMESHNHPSVVEPFQGAATGVGGILRDIFTMGARPIACLDSLRFGDPRDPRTRYLVDGVVRGIAHYGNCVGVPTVGGELVFDDCYAGNPLVNAMAVGLVETGRIARARAAGAGNPVMLVGARTGRDGIHACSVLASAEISEESLANRPAVQAGDPFTEKLLIEATLEALRTGAVVGIQDMGAAGITCATCETAAKGDAGMSIDVLKVPRREEGMTPYEVMLSESQERMLAIVEKGREAEVAAVFHKWDLNAVVIGQVTDDGFVSVYEGDTLAARVPARSLADECPTYELDAAEPAYIARVQAADISRLPEPHDCNAVLQALLSSPTLASKEWIYRQYDHMVQVNTVAGPGGDAAVLRVKTEDGGVEQGLALTADCNGRYCYLDPYEGARLAVAEAARNLACVGARPIGVTDCLNFGNPEKPEVFWQFRRAVDGLADACEALGLPVVSGNVSFYNETPESAIFPTPVIGMVGVMEDVSRRCAAGFQQDGDVIVLLCPTAPAPFPDGLGGSEYLKTWHGQEVGRPPALNLDVERALHEVARAAVTAEAGRRLRSAHDCSDGGLAVALAECAILGGRGAEITLPSNDASPAWQLFNEGSSRMVVSVPSDGVQSLVARAGAAGIGAHVLGMVGGDRLRIGTTGSEPWIDLALIQIAQTWREALPCLMTK